MSKFRHFWCWLWNELRLTRAKSDQIIHVNPVEGLKLPRISVNEVASVKALNPDQAAQLHTIGTALHSAGLCRLWPGLFLALGMGLRRGEVLGLKWADVDLERGTLRIRQTRVMDVDGITTATRRPPIQDGSFIFLAARWHSLNGTGRPRTQRGSSSGTSGKTATWCLPLPWESGPTRTISSGRSRSFWTGQIRRGQGGMGGTASGPAYRVSYASA
jgi:hypothetical protein